jgi:hypothetical protein
MNIENHNHAKLARFALTLLFVALVTTSANANAQLSKWTNRSNGTAYVHIDVNRGSGRTTGEINFVLRHGESHQVHTQSADRWCWTDRGKIDYCNRPLKIDKHEILR